MNHKSSYKAKLSLILIVVFTLALLILIILATWRNNASNALDVAVKDLAKPSKEINLTDNAIAKLFRIENSFRLYAATGQEQFKAEYNKGLAELKIMLDSLERSVDAKDEEGRTLPELLKKKISENNTFLKLKMVSDSLMQATAKLETFKAQSTPVFKPISKEEAGSFIEKTTVIVKKEQKPRRKLLGRIKDAISNKPDKQTATVTTTVSKVDGSASTQNDLTHRALNDLLKSSISKLTYNYKQLGEREKSLIKSNDHLLTELSSILKELKGLETEIHSSRSRQLHEDARVSLGEISYVTQIMLFISCLLALVILFNAWQLYVHDKKLAAAKDEAVKQTQARGDFLAHMSHEIRTPLNSILGFSEQLENSASPVQKEQVLSIRQSSKILLSIVNDILDLSKFETGNLNLHVNNFYPEKTIKHVISSLQVLADKKSVSLKCNCDIGADFMLAGDEYRLKQVLINLINNAIKFTEAGNVTVSAKVTDNVLFVDVADTGRGIAPENLNVIFDEFSQVTKSNDRERHNGSGLGLAISKKIVNAQGGEISVKSEFAKGSVFSFKVPYSSFRKDLVTDINKEVKPVLNTGLLAGKYLLVAEDDAMNIKLIQTIFKKWGVQFDIVESGNKAYDLFTQNNYDIILTDIHMPDGDGLSLTKKVREYPDAVRSVTPILAITANAMQKDLNDYENVGMNDHIVKPFTEERLFEKIRKGLGLG